MQTRDTRFLSFNLGALKVRQVSFDPVFTLDSPSLVPWVTDD